MSSTSKFAISPLIDSKKNIYATGTLRLRKFSPEGKLLWLFSQDEPGHTSPVLGDGVVYFRVGFGDGHNRVYALDMETGKVVFNKTVAGFRLWTRQPVSPADKKPSLRARLGALLAGWRV